MEKPKPRAVSGKTILAGLFLAAGLCGSSNAQSISVGSWAGTTTVQTVNNSAGAVMTCNAPAGYVVVGYEGANGAFMDRFRLVCRLLNPDGTLGATNYTCYNGTSTGGTPIGPYTFTPDKVMVGGNLRGGDNLDGLEGYGQAISSISVDSSNATGYATLTFLGNPSGGSFLGAVFVPDGNVVIGMNFQLSQFNGQLIFAGALGWNYAPVNVTTSVAALPVRPHGFSMYPVPATDNLTIHTAEPGKAVISDPAGRVHMEYSLFQDSFTEQVIDISSLPAGIYILSLGSQTRRFVKR